jgi:predicted RecA/RadA family phage recombinase
MPDSNNRLIKDDLLAALTPAEQRIAAFIPPASPPPPPPVPLLPPPEPNIPLIMKQLGDKNAQERTDALWDFLGKYGTQIAGDVFDQRVAAITAATDSGAVTTTNVTNNIINGGSIPPVSLTNASGGDVTAGTPVYISANNSFSVSRANASGTAIVFGFAVAAIASGAEGEIAWIGTVTIPAAIQTGTWAAGDTIYLDDLNAGKLTNVQPSTAGTYIIELGQVTVAPGGGDATLYIMKTSRILN